MSMPGEMTVEQAQQIKADMREYVKDPVFAKACLEAAHRLLVGENLGLYKAAGTMDHVVCMAVYYQAACVLLEHKYPEGEPEKEPG